MLSLQRKLQQQQAKQRGTSYEELLVQAMLAMLGEGLAALKAAKQLDLLHLEVHLAENEVKVDDGQVKGLVTEGEVQLDLQSLVLLLRQTVGNCTDLHQPVHDSGSDDWADRTAMEPASL